MHNLKFFVAVVLAGLTILSCDDTSVLPESGGLPAQQNLASAKIFYTQQIGNQLDVYSVNADGSNAQLVVESGGVTSSPDASTVIYQRFDDGNTGEIMAATPEGANIRQLTQSGEVRAYFAQLSPDGNTVAAYINELFGADTHACYLVHTDGSNAHIAFNIARETYPVFSPDGSMLAYYNGSDTTLNVRQINAGSDHVTVKLGFRYFDFGNDIAWFPSGEQIVFADGTDRDSLRELYTMNIHGGGAFVKISERGEISYQQPAVSPDGSSIAYIGVHLDNRESSFLMIMDADGNNNRLLHTPGPGTMYYSPRWSPDGKEILLVRSPYDRRDNDPVSIDVYNIPEDKVRILVAKSALPLAFWQR